MFKRLAYTLLFVTLSLLPAQVVIINSFTFQSGSSYLLDQYPGASLAYSLRELSSAWVGQDVIRVEESGGSTQQDFTAAEITDGTLVAFCGANDGYVVTWYDQSGNGRDLTSSGVAPRIVIAGTLQLDVTGFPVINSSSLDNGLDVVYDAGTMGYLNEDCSIFTVTTANPDAGSGALFGTGATSFLVYGRWAGSGNRGIFINGVGNSGPNPSTENMSVVSAFALSDGFNLGYENGTERVNSAGTTSYELGSVALWRRGTASCNYETAEFIFYESDQTANRAAIEAEQNAYYGIF